MDAVVPYVGTWIEIEVHPRGTQLLPVVPYVGTWIEMCCRKRRVWGTQVVPYVGTWIEMVRPSMGILSP